MSRHHIAAAIVIGSILVAYAVDTQAGGNPDNGPGCGLGKLAWMDYSGPKQIAPQVMMATTNATFGSQTFGISSGTSGCTNDGVVMKSKHVSLTSGSFKSLEQEMAQGQGEHLAALATLLGIQEQDQPAFFRLLQEKYSTLIPSEHATPLSMLEAIRAAMAEHPLLRQTAFVTDPSWEENK
ncbi:MAG: DUF3015 domain-containing protein [Nitrospiraceae bacterium]|nr:DUF3015 domain-containing protein [Nitrospiraceae bacterium]